MPKIIKDKQASYALTGQTLKIYWQHARRYGKHVALITAGIVGAELLQVYTPILYRNLINTLTASVDRSIGVAVHIILIILVLNLLRAVLLRVSIFSASFMDAKVMGDLMRTCYEYLQKHSYGFFSSRFVGSLVTKVRRYERSFETISDQLFFDLGGTLLDMILIIGYLLWRYRFFGYVVLGWAVLYIFFAYLYSMFKLKYDLKRAAADTQTTAQLADGITNNINVKLFTGYQAEKKRFSDVVQEQFVLRLKSWNLGNIGDAVQSFLSVALEFIVVYYAVRLWQSGTITVGDIVLLQAYLLRLFDRLWSTGRNIRNIYEALADGN